MDKILKFRDTKMFFSGISSEMQKCIRIINDKATTTKTVCIVAGIHGDELEGIIALTTFTSHYEFSEYPNKYPNIRLLTIPIANPYGFLENKRRGFKNRDINRHFFDKPLKYENKLLFDLVKNEKIDIFLSLHEDLTAKAFYMYDQNKEATTLDNNIIKRVEKILPINRSRQICWDKAKNGIICNVQDKSFERLMYAKGVPYCITTETPGRQPVQKRIDAGIAIIEEVLKFASCV